MAINAREDQASNPDEDQTMENRTIVDEITTDMIILDLAKGHGREAIAKKYAFKDEITGEVQPFEMWMVTKMFKHPLLKNRKAFKVRALPFKFDMPEEEVTEPKAPVIEPKDSIPGTEGGHQSTNGEDVPEEENTIDLN